MRQDAPYEILLIISHVGEIVQSSCKCPGGKGPKGTCKHIAALCYAVDDFVKVFVQAEDEIVGTEKLSQWNQPRGVKFAATPIYSINMEKLHYGKQSKPILGKHPSYYQIDKACPTDIASAREFITK